MRIQRLTGREPVSDVPPRRDEQAAVTRASPKVATRQSPPPCKCTMCITAVTETLHACHDHPSFAQYYPCSGSPTRLACRRSASVCPLGRLNPPKHSLPPHSSGRQRVYAVLAVGAAVGRRHHQNQSYSVDTRSLLYLPIRHVPLRNAGFTITPHVQRILPVNRHLTISVHCSPCVD